MLTRCSYLNFFASSDVIGYMDNGDDGDDDGSDHGSLKP